MRRGRPPPELEGRIPVARIRRNRRECPAGLRGQERRLHRCKSSENSDRTEHQIPRPGKDAAPAARLRMRFYPGFESGKHRGGESRGHARSLTQARMLNIGKPGASTPGDFHSENLTSFREKSQNELDIPKSHANIRPWEKSQERN